ncbi:MAG: alpha/beta fold hydrolase [Polyangiales bacterium]
MPLRSLRRSALLLAACALIGCAARTPMPTRTVAPVLARRERLEPDPEFGGQVYVLEAGRADAPPLVLVHGLSDAGARDWEPVLSALSRHYHVLAFDLPGFGRSTRAHQVYAPQRFVRFVSGLIARHFTGPVAVVGHSMGGAIALALAGDHPEQVERLALLDVAGVLHYRDYLRAVVRAEQPDDNLFVRGLKEVRGALFEVGLFPVQHRKLEDLGLAARPRFRRVLTPSRAAAVLFVQHDFGPAMRRVRAPTFVGWGRRDTIAPMRTADALRHVLAPRRFRVFERSGHTPMRTEPEAVANALRDFLDASLAPQVADGDDDARREGVCDHERDRVFEGSYARVTLRRCKRAVLRDVRTRALVIERSSAELVGVTVRSDDVGVTIARSDVRWTGGDIVAPTCMDTDKSQLNLFAVTCAATREAMRVHMPSSLFASASELRRGDQAVLLHGAYELFRTHASETGAGMTQASARAAARRPRARRPPLRAEDLGKPQLTGADLRAMRLADADLRAANLQGADLRGATLSRARLAGADLRGARLDEARLDGADLRGADLRGADLRETSLAGATFDDATSFSSGFDPDARGMRRDAESR